MIFITPNPAIDRIIIVPGIRVGEVHRSSNSMVVAGGKGLNAARAVRSLGGISICMGFIGGNSGRFVARLAQEEGLECAWTSTRMQTRTCYHIIDETSGETTVVNEYGPVVKEECWDLLETDILATLSLRGIETDGYICFCGSLPPGDTLSRFGGLIRTLGEAGHNVWVDTSGEALRVALDSAPAGIKVNAAEAGAALGRYSGTMEEVLAMTESIRSRGIPSVILTMGKNGAILANEQGTWQAAPPEVRAGSASGSGDAFFGAFILALEQNKSQPDALCDGVAAGAANTLAPGGGRFARATFDALRANVALYRIR